MSGWVALQPYAWLCWTIDTVLRTSCLEMWKWRPGSHQIKFVRTTHHPNNFQGANRILFIGWTVKNTTRRWHDRMVEILGIKWQECFERTICIDLIVVSKLWTYRVQFGFPSMLARPLDVIKIHVLRKYCNYIVYLTLPLSCQCSRCALKHRPLVVINTAADPLL